MLRGERPVQPSLAVRALDQLARGGDQPAATEAHLTPRQLEILCLVATGRSNAEIAVELRLTLNTVKTHVVHVLRKLGAADRTQAAVRAAHLGLLEDSPFAKW